MAEVATALKMGTTGLVLQLIEEGHRPAISSLDEPVETLQELSQDQSRQWIVRLQSGKTISAIDIQEAFLAAAQAHYRGQDDETDWVLDQWEAVLQDLRGDYQAWSAGSIGPRSCGCSKPFARRNSDVGRSGAEESRPGEFTICIRHGALFRSPRRRAGASPDDGQGDCLAMDHPPRNTRAFGRGELIRHFWPRASG